MPVINVKPKVGRPSKAVLEERRTATELVAAFSLVTDLSFKVGELKIFM